MLIYRAYRNKSLRRFFWPEMNNLFRIYFKGIIFSVIGFLVVIWMIFNVLWYMYKPGNWVYVFIILTCVNIFSTYKSIQSNLEMRKTLKLLIGATEIGAKLHDIGISLILESIKQHKIEKSKNRNDFKSDVENTS